MKFRPRLAILGAVVALPLIMGAASIPQPAINAVPYETVLSSPAQPGSPPLVEENYSAIVDSLFNVEPNMWGGAYVDANVLVVKTVGYTIDEAAAKLRAIGVLSGIRLISSDTSIAQLEALTAKVIATGNVNIVSAGPQFATSRVVVGVMNSDIAQRQALYQLGGSKIAEYDAGGYAVSTSRYYDTTPFWGGAHIIFSSGGPGQNCTSGFAWNPPSGSSQYMISAGHCYTQLGNSYPTVNSVTSSGALNPIGSVAWSSIGTSGTLASRHGDLSIYKMSGSNATQGYLYVGTYDTSNSRRVIGRVSLPEGWKGSNVYTSGAGPALGNGTGQVLLDWISLVNQTVSYPDLNQTISNLSFGENASTCAGGGDSGGAVYQENGTLDAYAVGIISGTNNEGGGWTNCRNYFTPIGYVASDWGGSIKTS